MPRSKRVRNLVSHFFRYAYCKTSHFLRYKPISHEQAPSADLAKMEMKPMETREERQAKLTARIAELRARADAKEAEANRIRGAVNSDPAFWTQPAYSNAAGRSFARNRDRERSRLIKAGEIAADAKALRERADAMEGRGVRMAGDAAAEREEAIAAADFAVGQPVKTIYGVSKVVKVNAKSILIEGSFGPIKVEKHLAQAA